MIVGLFVGTIGFQYLFEQVNKKDLSFVNRIHEKTRALKHKKVIQYLLMIIISVIMWSIMDLRLVGGALQGGIIGFIWALIMFSFEDTIFDNMRNTLR